MNALGGAGKDRMTVNTQIGGLAEDHAPPPVRSHLRLGLNFVGGAGADRIIATTRIMPTLDLPHVTNDTIIDGGAGDDILSVNGSIDPAALVGFNPQPEPPILRVGGDVNGGAGNDHVSGLISIRESLPVDVEFNFLGVPVRTSWPPRR